MSALCSIVGPAGGAGRRRSLLGGEGTLPQRLPISHPCSPGSLWLRSQSAYCALVPALVTHQGSSSSQVVRAVSGSRLPWGLRRPQTGPRLMQGGTFEGEAQRGHAWPYSSISLCSRLDTLSYLDVRVLGPQSPPSSPHHPGDLTGLLPTSHTLHGSPLLTGESQLLCWIFKPLFTCLC